MTSIDGRVKGFIDTWEKRKSGELPMPDSTVLCSKCGILIMGDQRIEFTNGGIVCIPCYDKSKHEDTFRFTLNDATRSHTAPGKG